MLVFVPHFLWSGTSPFSRSLAIALPSLSQVVNWGISCPDFFLPIVCLCCCCTLTLPPAIGKLLLLFLSNRNVQFSLCSVTLRIVYYKTRDLPVITQKQTKNDSNVSHKSFQIGLFCTTAVSIKLKLFLNFPWTQMDEGEPLHLWQTCLYLWFIFANMGIYLKGALVREHAWAVCPL